MAIAAADVDLGTVLTGVAERVITLI